MPTGLAWLLVGVCTAVTFIIGFLWDMVAVCGYMAGLIGSSKHSPISGIGIISIVMASPVLLMVNVDFSY